MLHLSDQCFIDNLNIYLQNIYKIYMPFLMLTNFCVCACVYSCVWVYVCM